MIEIFNWLNYGSARQVRVFLPAKNQLEIAGVNSNAASA
jgi:hypothetical protein